MGLVHVVGWEVKGWVNKKKMEQVNLEDVWVMEKVDETDEMMN